MPRSDNDFTGPGWKKVWGDEFDTKGLPDPNKWDYEKGLVRNRELQYYTVRRPENARLEDGTLILEARKEDFEKASYTAASLITRGRAGWQYGRFVLRAKLPGAVGAWPAFWMLGEDITRVSWPRCGEIDVLEYVGHNPGVVHATVHQAGADGKHVQKGGTIRIADAADAFHVYAAEWHPDRLDFFVDDRKYFSYANDGKNPWSFDKKFYLLLNLAIGGSWGGQKGVDAAAFPQRYVIDYVRVYQKTS